MSATSTTLSCATAVFPFTVAGDLGFGVAAYLGQVGRIKSKQILAAAGWSSDHEAITAAEVTNHLRAGMYTMLRHSSLRPDVLVLAEAVTPERARSGRLMLTADGPEAATIAREGYLDHVIRRAIAAGIEPVLAYQMATLAPATYVGLDEDLGGIAPGRRANVVVLDDLSTGHADAGGGTETT